MGNVLYDSGQKDAAKNMLDPELTEKGRQQAVAVAENPLLAPALSDRNGLQLVVASPLRRTVDTALLAFQSWLPGQIKKKGWHRVHLLSDLREIGREVVPCNTGSPLDALKERFEVDAKLIDYRELQPGWDDGGSRGLPWLLTTTSWQPYLASASSMWKCGNMGWCALTTVWN